jgi:caffeoyl-CoA O-methyltransferase
LGPEGRLAWCDVSEEWTAIPPEYWHREGVADRVELRLGPAIDTLRFLPVEEQSDLAFVDADNTGYVARRSWPGCAKPPACRQQPQGGRILKADADDDSTVAICSFNDHDAGDPRMRVLLLPHRRWGELHPENLKVRFKVRDALTDVYSRLVDSHPQHLTQTAPQSVRAGRRQA